MTFLWMFAHLFRAATAQAEPSSLRCKVVGAPALRKLFKVAPDLSREVVLADLSRAQKGIGLIALALHADAVDSGGGKALVRLGATRRALREADSAWLQARAVAVAIDHETQTTGIGRSPHALFDALQAIRKRRTPTPQQADNSAFEVRNLTPAADLLAALLRTLPKASYASIEPGTKAFFSNHPIGAERALAPFRATLANYVAAQSAFADWSNLALEQGKIEERDAWVFARGDFILGERTVLLAVDRTEREPSFSVQVFDPTGRREAGAGFFAALLPLRSPTTSLGKATLPSDAVAEREGRAFGEATFRPDSLNPESHEPLDGEVRAALCLYAKARGFDQIVACVPDALLRPVREAVRGTEVDLDAVAKSLDREGCETLAQGPTLIVRPAQPLAEEAIRVDRRPLGSAFERAASGRFDFAALVDLHAAYATTYSHRAFIGQAIEPLRQAFALNKVQGWSFPHPLLALLGETSADQQAALLSGTAIRLDAERHSEGLYALAEGSQSTAGTDLSRTPLRLLASPLPASLSCKITYQTAVRRVSKGVAARRTVDGVTGMVKTEQGENLIMDDEYTSLDSLLLDPEPGSPFGYGWLDKRYRFLWRQEATLAISASIGGVVGLGPSLLSRTLRESREAVDLGSVPGVGSSLRQNP